jgi:NhaA family Na+:H+ antiporter
VLQSGIHATLAGVAVALTVPLSKGDSHADDTHSPLHRLEHGLQPLVTYLIVPVFGFFNAGVDLRGLTLAQAASPVPLGVAVGLVAGKAIGVSLAILLLVRLGLASRPAGAGPMAIAGLATLCGIGFTMSLFIAGLAFGEGSAEHDAAKLGVLAGTVLAALLGWLILSLSAKRRA